MIAIKSGRAMGEDEAFDPIPIGLLGAEREAFEAHHFPALLLKRSFGLRMNPSAGRFSLCGSPDEENIVSEVTLTEPCVQDYSSLHEIE